MASDNIGRGHQVGFLVICRCNCTHRQTWETFTCKRRHEAGKYLHMRGVFVLAVHLPVVALLTDGLGMYRPLLMPYMLSWNALNKGGGGAFYQSLVES